MTKNAQQDEFNDFQALLHINSTTFKALNFTIHFLCNRKYFQKVYVTFCNVLKNLTAFLQALTDIVTVANILKIFSPRSKSKLKS